MTTPARPDPFVGLTVPSENQPGVSFKIERQLGEGGTAVAYFATRSGPEGRSPVVLKVILPSVILQAGDTARMIVQKESVLEDLSAMLAMRAGSPPLLCATAGGHWLKPLPVLTASALLGIARLSEERWLVCGRSAEGQGLSAVYEPLMWDLQPLATTEARAMTACASRPERGIAIAVGASGWVLRLENGQQSVEQLAGAPDLSAVCLDMLGRIWAGAAGELWFCEAGSRAFQRVWHDPSWQAPFVSIFADFGMVFAATADGAVLEGRATISQLVSFRPPPRN